MNDKNIFDALRDIDPQWILDAAPAKRTNPARTWIKWGSLAACFCLVVAAIIGAVLWLQPDDSGSPELTLPPHDHIFGEWQITKDATCSQNGEETRLCSCGEKETRTVALLPHFAGAWVVEKEPTIKIPTPDDPDEREPGLKCQFCDRCGAKLDEELIPATGSLGLAYAINPDGKTFSVAGIGNCTDEDVIIPENFCGYHVTSVMSNAFRECETIKSVTLPDTVTVIGQYAFADCKTLEYIYLPQGLVEIGERAFWDCITLKKIDIPSTVTVIQDGAFTACRQLESVVIPNQITVLAPSVFSSCTKLKSVTLPAGLVSIGERAFDGCERLQTIDIPSGVTQIGAHAFSSCSSLVRVDLPMGLTVIEEKLFQWCYSLTTVTIPEGVESIENDAFRDCISLVNIDIPNSVTKIGSAAFLGCSSLKRIVIPEGVEVIERNLFNYCSKLTEVILPYGITSIGYSAFDACKSLVSIDLPTTVTSIDRRAFAECDAMERIVIPEGVQTIIGGTFYGCNNLREVIIPNSVKCIESDAFSGCNRLLQKKENGVSYVGNWAVAFDKTVNEIVLKHGTVGIAENTFYLIDDLVSITLPNSLKYINGYGLAYNWNSEWEMIFLGTPEEWEEIEKLYNWDGSSTYTLIFASELSQ